MCPLRGLRVVSGKVKLELGPGFSAFGETAGRLLSLSEVERALLQKVVINAMSPNLKRVGWISQSGNYWSALYKYNFMTR